MALLARGREGCWVRLARPGRPGSAPGGPRCPGAVFSEDAQPRLAVGKTKTREGERPASGHTVSEAGAGAGVPAGTSRLARGLRRRGKRLGSEQRGAGRVRPRQHPASAPAGPPPGRRASPSCVARSPAASGLCSGGALPPVESGTPPVPPLPVAGLTADTCGFVFGLFGVQAL